MPDIYDIHDEIHYLQDQPDSNCELCREEARVDAIERREDAFEYEGLII